MPDYKTFQEQGIYQFATDSNGNLQYISGTTELFGKQFLADVLITGDVELNGYQNEVRASGDIIAFYSSDRKMKDNIVDIANPLDKIKQLNGVTFDWNEKGPKWSKIKRFNPDNLNDVGVIAQDVQKVLPQAVRTKFNADKSDSYLSVDYKRLIPLLIEGIKEQQNQIDELKLKIKTLEDDVNN